MKVLHGLLQYAKKVAEEAPYSIKPAANGETAVWKHQGQGCWIKIATFARKDDAEAFVFIMGDPVLGEWR